MSLSEALLPEFDQEMANTRRMLERVPQQHLRWRPHEKSMTLARLAAHLAEIPSWAVQAVENDSVDIAPPGAGAFQPREPESMKEVLQLFDSNVARARTAIAGASDSHLMHPWSLLAGGKTVMTLPRSAVLRSWVMNHSIHHRAQLGVYLRLKDVPLPAIYGPSADEGSMV